MESENTVLENPVEGIKGPTVERVRLGAVEAAKVASWMKQIEKGTSGFLQLSRSEILNFLIRNKSEQLSGKEINQIRSDHYDPVRHISWIMPQIKLALESGDLKRVAALQSEIRKIELSNVRDEGAGVTGLSASRAARKSGKSSKPRRADKTEFKVESQVAENPSSGGSESVGETN